MKFLLMIISSIFIFIGCAGVSSKGSDINSIVSECEKGNMKSCTGLAIMYENHCKTGSIADCHNLGLMYFNGKGVNQDYTVAKGLFEKSCNGGDAGGCSALGYMYEKVEGVKQDNNQALFYAKKACDLDKQFCSSYEEFKKGLGR